MTEADTDPVPASGTGVPARRRRRWIWGGLGLVALLAVTGVWVGLGLRAAAPTIQSHADAAQSALHTVQDDLTAGDYVGARAAAARARDEVTAAQEAANAAPVRVAGFIPVAATAVHDLDALISAASLVTDASASVVDTYARVAGKQSGEPPLFAKGAVNLAVLATVTHDVDQISASLDQAASDLSTVRGTVPGTAKLATARDAALRDIARVQGTVTSARDLLPLLPDALGASSPKHYLITILNQGEMRASGGAPLSIAVVTLDKGALSITMHNAISHMVWRRGGRYVWVGAPGSPWNRPNGTRHSAFWNANVHPDWRSSGFDLHGAWNATGYTPVDGVVGIDLTAVAAVLRATGPIDHTAFGTLTADNLGQVLLVNAYRNFASDQGAREEANQQLVTTLVERLTSGSSLITVLKSLGSVAPGRHFQVWAADSSLEKQMGKLGLDGRIDFAAGEDAVAFYTQNENASKVDVFQTRDIHLSAVVNVDGSADVTQRITVANAIPKDVPVDNSVSHYTTGWSKPSFVLYTPVGATQPALTLPPGFEIRPWVTGATWTDDGYGHTLIQTIGWIAPRASTLTTLKYHLPAGTFTTTSGGLTYRLRIEPQPTWLGGSLTVDVSGPTGTHTVKHGTLDTRADMTIEVH